MNWKNDLKRAMKERGENLKDIVAGTMSESEMMEEFDCSYGVVEGCSFTVWTENTVYFPICYDGSEWVGSVSRNPDGKPTKHQGG